MRELLTEPRYRQRAQALAAEYARYDAVTLAVETVEGLATRAAAARAVEAQRSEHKT